MVTFAAVIVAGRALRKSDEAMTRSQEDARDARATSLRIARFEDERLAATQAREAAEKGAVSVTVQRTKLAAGGETLLIENRSKLHIDVVSFTTTRDDPYSFPGDEITATTTHKETVPSGMTSQVAIQVPAGQRFKAIRFVDELLWDWSLDSDRHLTLFNPRVINPVPQPNAHDWNFPTRKRTPPKPSLRQRIGRAIAGDRSPC